MADDIEIRKIEKPRIQELDLLKALAIIAMIICHCVEVLGEHRIGYENDFLYFLGYSVLGDYVAVAHAFMFAMGVAIIWTGKDDPRHLIRRGVRIYIMAFVLNFFRYGIYAIIDGLIEGQFHEDTVYALVVQDIFHFAGLALIFTGFLKYLKLKDMTILAIAVVMSAIGGPLAFVFDKSPVLNYLLGHLIVTTERESCFALLNWYVFVAFGMLFARLLEKSEDQDTFYRRLLCVAGPIAAVYIILTCIFGSHFLSKNGWYYAASFPESVGLLSIDFSLMAAFHFLINKADAPRLTVFFGMGRNLTKIYIIHWCILGFVDSIFCYLLEIVFPYWFMYLFGIVLVVLSSWIAVKWKRRLATQG